MVKLNTPTGWGTVRDPETGERHDVDADLDREVAERIVATHGAASLANEDSALDQLALDIADEDYQTAAEMVDEGEADDVLDDLKEADDRATVQDAIEERRAWIADGEP